MSSVMNIIGANDFTVEFWINPVLDTNRYVITSGIFNVNQWYIYLLTTGAVQVFLYDYSSSSSFLDTTSTTSYIKSNVWSHIAFVRKGSKYTVFINGNSAVSTISTSQYLINNSSSLISIGYNVGTTGTSYFKGSIDEFRITNGSARYINNFNVSPLTSSLPVQSYPYNVNLLSQSQSLATNTAINLLSTGNTNIDPFFGNVVCLIHFDNSNFQDDSKYNMQFYNTNVTFSSAISLSNGTIKTGSGYFNGNSALVFPYSQIIPSSIGSPFTFTNMSATGVSGPTSITYNPLPSAGLTLNSGIQYWTVPSSKNYTIIAAGAAGGDYNGTTIFGGGGVIISNSFNLIAGHIIKILIGQKGQSGGGTQPGGGGGATFIYNQTTSQLLLCAAGGGGAGTLHGANDSDTYFSYANGNAAYGGSANGGTGGNSSYGLGNFGYGGAGYSGDGGTIGYDNGNPSTNYPQYAAKSFTNGGQVSALCGSIGGFGGGGGSNGGGNGGGGGGGGYTGGNGGNGQSPYMYSFGGSPGSGGGSYDINGTGYNATLYTSAVSSSDGVFAGGYCSGYGFIRILL